MANPFREELAKRNVEPEDTGPGFMDYATWGTRGANVGLSQVLGMPVDITAGLMRTVGVPIPEEPIGGAKSIRRGMEAVSGLMDKPSTYESIEEVPPAYRPVARGGEVVGGSAPFIVAPYAAAARGATGGMFAPVVAGARDFPKTFGALEGVSTAGAATGAGLAETIFPGETGPRVVGEITGGVVAPGAVLGRGIMQAPAVMNRIRQLTSKSGKEAAAGKAVRDVMERTGESPAAAITALEAPTTIPGLQYPAAAKSGSPTIAALEENIIRTMPEVGNNIRDQMRQATETLNRAYRLAVQSGDPQAIREASQARQQWFQDMLDARVATAEQNVARARAEMGPTQTAADASEEARKGLQEALSNARKAERELWADVPKDIQITPTGTTEAYAAVRADMLPEQNMPSPAGFNLEAFLRRAQTERVTSGDLQKARSLTLQEADNLRAAGDFNSARLMDNLADGMLNDIAGLSEDARSFSRALNETFRRPNVERILARTRQGAERVAPEQTLDVTMRRGGRAGDVAARELEAATQFGGQTTLPQQEQFLRNMVRDTLGPDGKVSPDRLNRFRLDNREMLERFPELNRAIADTETAQLAADRVARQSAQTRKAAEQSAFARLAGFEDPARGIRTTLTGRNPLEDYRQIATTARRGGPEAVSGLRGATFDALFDMANTGDLVSGRAMRELLTRRAGSGDSLVDTMQQSGILNQSQRDNLFRVIDEVERIENMMQSGRQIDEVLEEASVLEDLAARIVGANLGGASGLAQASGSGLVLAQAGSRRMRELINDLPMQRTQEILAEAIQNPEYMAMLLRKPQDAAQRRQLYRQINAFLLQTAAPEEDETQTYVGP